MLNNTKRSFFGVLGEDMAESYLIHHGYNIVARNYAIGFDEIDIIVKANDGTLVFCEVKTMRGASRDFEVLMPEDNLTALKQRKLARSAQIFANRYPNHVDDERGWRIDLIAVVLGANNILLDLRHYENI